MPIKDKFGKNLKKNIEKRWYPKNRMNSKYLGSLYEIGDSNM